MVFGFGRKKRSKNTDPRTDDVGDTSEHVQNGRRLYGQNSGDAAPTSIQPPNRPDSMGTIRVQNQVNPDAFTAQGTESTFTTNTTVKLDEIPDILSNSDNIRHAKVVSSAKAIRDTVEPMIEELIQMGRDLEKDDLNVDSIDKHLAIIVVRGKKQVIDTIRRGVLRLPEVHTIGDAIRMESLLRQLLKKIGDVLGRQTRVIHIFAKKHAARFKETLEILNSEHVKMRHIIDQHNRDDLESQDIRNALDALVRRRESRSKRSQRVTDIASSIDTLKRQEHDLKRDLSQITSSSEYKIYTEILSELKKCDDELNRITHDTNLQFEKISRPLGRYKYGSSLDKSQQHVLEGLVSDPTRVILPENLKIISEIISNVRRAVASGSISVRDTDKTIAMLADTADLMSPLAERISKCMQRQKTLSADLDTSKPVGLDACKEGIAKANALCADNEKRLVALRADVDEDDSAIPSMISEIQISLRQHTGMRYDIIP